MLQQLPRDIRVLLGELPEVPKGHHEAVQGPVRGHRRRADALADQRQLAEVVAGTEQCDLTAADADRRRSIDDDEEADPAHLALADHRGPRLELALPETACELLQLSLREPAEKRNLLELVGEARHRLILTANQSDTRASCSRT